MPYPTDLNEVNTDLKQVKRALREAGVPDSVISAIDTRALRSGRRQTGEFQSNRASRWRLDPRDPQYGSELECKLILAKLLGSLLEFHNAPKVDDATKKLIEDKYLFHTIAPSSYRDALLLEALDYRMLRKEADDPTHGHSNFHIGHHDPTIVPKHTADNIFWRTHRSNLIQGNMTLREARIYILKLIGRYFELGELEVK